MSQINLTNDERVQRLERFGYSSREAAFLCLAALHGGYFLRRQYGRFLDRALGGNVASLIEKAVRHEHVQATTFAGQTQVYHLCARPVYAALGQKDNRNRRLRCARVIRAKLMGLDFVLANQEHVFLATEIEKTHYFTRILGIESDTLPSKRYVSQGRATTRFFVEKYPIFVSGNVPDGAQAAVSFCYVDEGAASVAGFATFLQQYTPLLAQIPDVHVVYVGSRNDQARSARTAFERWQERVLQQNACRGDFCNGRLLAYFRSRREYEKADWSSFDRARLIQFRNDAREFSGGRYETLYRLWHEQGEAAIHAALNAAASPPRNVKATFSMHVLEHDYDFLGYFARG